MHRDKKEREIIMRRTETDAEVLVKLIALLPQMPEREQYRLLGYGERMADEKEEKEEREALREAK